jgi:hypothetical protein
MIGTTKGKNGELEFADESELLKNNKEDGGEEILKMVQAALRGGLTDFTTPTTSDGQGRIDWKVRQWMTIRGGKPACFLVAYQVLNAHFEVLGPEVELQNGSPGPRKAGA